jgi:chemotaxis signal transduction protein
MYTLLDTATLLSGQDVKPLAGQDPNAHAHEGVSAESRTLTPRFAVALRGDEQLALAADEVEGPLELDAESADPPEASALHPAPLRATLRRVGEPLHLLDPSRLFDAAMQGTERRRRRS